MILRLPQGYGTQIGEGGANLSSGQRQRIGLARALYGNPRLVVLDEPNSNLDPDGEAALIAAIKRLSEQGVTVVVVTHRTNLLGVIDNVLLLQQGAVVFFGERDTVMAQMRQANPPPVRQEAAVSPQRPPAPVYTLKRAGEG